MKRLTDVGLAALILIVFSPIIACVAIAVRVRLGSPVMFRHVRPGKDGELFTLLKFRTMSQASVTGDDSDEARMTGLGRFLRSTSLDELPELVNVLRGDMSLVGPRPLLPEYLPLYSLDQRRRHSVRPGLTGWAQVNGRNAITWKQKFDYDIWYVDNQSIALDFKILALTLRKVFSREGITADGHVTIERFGGNA
ncbi:MAG: sugar transferase [Gemmatimonadaceae bacterium]|nr:sugar transferase [Gemmatimonadaceae bacterium]